MLQTELETTSELCNDGSIQSTFDCLNKLYNKCAKTKEGNRDLDLVVDANRWKDAMNNICNHIHYLKDHAECEDRVQGEFNTCVKRQLEHFSRQKGDIYEADMTDMARTDALIEITCLNTDKVLNCLKRPFEKYCPMPMTTLLINTVKSFTPRVCANKIPTITGYHPEKNKHLKDVDISADRKTKMTVMVGGSSQSDDQYPNTRQGYVPDQVEPELPPRNEEFDNRGIVGAANKQTGTNGASMGRWQEALYPLLIMLAIFHVQWAIHVLPV